MIAIEHTLRSLDQCNQQIVFAGAQRHRNTVIAKQRAGAGVQTPAVEMVTLGFLLRVFLRHCILAAAQDGFDPSDQLAAAEGLREVIVGSHFQADDTVDLLALRGQHDDRDVRLGAKCPAKRKPVLARQHEIEEDEIDAAISQDLAHGAAVRRRADPESLLGQRARDKIANLAMIVDDKDVRPTLHFCNIDQRMWQVLRNMCRIMAAAAFDKLCHKKPCS